MSVLISLWWAGWAACFWPFPTPPIPSHTMHRRFRCHAFFACWAEHTPHTHNQSTQAGASGCAPTAFGRPHIIGSLSEWLPPLYSVRRRASAIDFACITHTPSHHTPHMHTTPHTTPHDTRQRLGRSPRSKQQQQQRAAANSSSNQKTEDSSQGRRAGTQPAAAAAAAMAAEAGAAAGKPLKLSGFGQVGACDLWQAWRKRSAAGCMHGMGLCCPLVPPITTQHPHTYTTHTQHTVTGARHRRRHDPRAAQGGGAAAVWPRRVAAVRAHLPGAGGADGGEFPGMVAVCVCVCGVGVGVLWCGAPTLRAAAAWCRLCVDGVVLWCVYIPLTTQARALCRSSLHPSLHPLIPYPPIHHPFKSLSPWRVGASRSWC